MRGACSTSSESDSEAAPRGRCQSSSPSLSANSLPSSTARPGGGGRTGAAFADACNICRQTLIVWAW